MSSWNLGTNWEWNIDNLNQRTFFFCEFFFYNSYVISKQSRQKSDVIKKTDDTICGVTLGNDTVQKDPFIVWSPFKPKHKRRKTKSNKKPTIKRKKRLLLILILCIRFRISFLLLWEGVDFHTGTCLVVKDRVKFVDIFPNY